jgi:DNA (cytosine-5)-methyltransferase 1
MYGLSSTAAPHGDRLEWATNMARTKAITSLPTAVDLFCGAGGLTHGLIRAGISVSAGIDIDPACKFPFEANNNSNFVSCDILKLTTSALEAMYPKGSKRVLVGCAPCQAFSRYARRPNRPADRKWGLLGHFTRLIDGVKPVVVSMENVPELARDATFEEFVESLQASGYKVNFSSVYCPDYGIAQHRTRLVLLASLLGEIALLPATHKPAKYRTVKDVIGKLKALSSGEVDLKDTLHRACKLSELNARRIKVSRPGGCWRDWPEELVADCHRAESGKTYPSVYGRMEWTKPSPTITTQFFGYGNGRFGHPEQNRAISLREGAILQSFPKSYKFCRTPGEVSFSVLGRLIGNAVPVRLGEVIGRSILKHLAETNG